MTNEKKTKEMEDATWGEYHVSQKLILWRASDDKFLIVRASDEQRFKDRYPGYEFWGFIGGHVDAKDASAEDALTREAVEEAGSIEYDIIGPVWVSLEKTSLRIGYLAEYKDGEVTLSEEHSEMVWQTAEEIEKEKLYHPMVKEAIRAAQERLKERGYLDDLKRLQADFENYKKRQAESQKELAGYLIEKLLFDIIPVLDNFRMATGHVPEEAKDSPWVTGIQYIEKQLEDALKSHGVEVMEVKEGDAFNPSIHEAISGEAANKESGIKNQEKEVITKVLQNGYKIGGRVVRPAKVTVK